MFAGSSYATQALTAAFRNFLPGQGSPLRQQERKLNGALRGYPPNHTYRISAGRLLPGLRLYHRLRILDELYPQPLTSFLDVGSCKGFFVLDAARRPECLRAVGIDVYVPFIKAAEAMRLFTAAENASFHLAGLADVAADPAAFGGPFQTVTVLNVYHYLFWGSGLDQTAARDHATILKRLATVCTDRVIFSSPLEVSECPGEIRRAAQTAGGNMAYTRDDFLTVADRFFTIKEAAHSGRRPVFVLTRRPSN